MVTQSDGVRLCDECEKEAPIDGLLPFHGMCGRCGEVLPGDPAPEPNAHDKIRALSFQPAEQCGCGANVAHWIVRGRVARCNGCGTLTEQAEAEDDIERARRGPVPAETVGTAAQEKAIVRAAVAWYLAIKPGAANPSPVALFQRVRELLDAQEEAAAKESKRLARYAREIDAARESGLTITAERIEAERAEYQERGS